MARLYVTCPGPGIPRFIYSRLATSLRSLALILPYLPLYYSTLWTSTFATVATDIPSYEAIRGHMPFHQYDLVKTGGNEAVMSSQNSIASRFYQLKSGHALIAKYLRRIGKRIDIKCWWFGHEYQMRDRLFK
jgi:hypothetical protein